MAECGRCGFISNAYFRVRIYDLRSLGAVLGSPSTVFPVLCC